MASKARNGDIILAFSGKWVSWVHTVVAYSAFVGALITGLSLHYHKIVQNEYYVTFMVSQLGFLGADHFLRDILKSGSLRFLRPLETDIRNDRFSSSS